MLSETFSARQVAYIAELPYQTVDSWSKKYTKPSVQKASGRGSARVYSFLDVVLIRTISELRKLGCSSVLSRSGSLKHLLRRTALHYVDRVVSEPTYIVMGPSNVLLTTHKPSEYLAAAQMSAVVIVNVPRVVAVCGERTTKSKTLNTRRKR